MHGASPSSSSSSSSSSPLSNNSLLPVVNALFTTFSIIVLGYLMGVYKLIPTSVGKGLGTFLFQVSLPCLIFHSVATMSFTGVNWWIWLALLLAKVCIFLVVLCIGYWKKNLQTGAVWSMFCTQSNDFALGLPLLKALYSTTHPSYPTYIFLAAPISLVILNPVGFVLMEIGSGKQKGSEGGDGGDDALLIDADVHGTKKTTAYVLLCQAVVSTLKNPLVLSVIAGLVSNVLFGGKLNSFAADPILLCGEAFDGVALFCLGLSVCGKLHRVKGKASIFPISMVFIKIFVLPLVAKLIFEAGAMGSSSGGNGRSPTANPSDLVFLLGMFPTAPGVFLYAVRYQLTNEAGILSFATALGTLVSAPFILVAAIFVFLHAAGNDAYMDHLSLQVELFVGAMSTFICVLVVMPVVCSFVLHRHKWRHELNAREHTSVLLILLACFAHIVLLVAASTCSTSVKEYDVLRWSCIFGCTLLYRFSTMGIAFIMILHQRRAKFVNTVYLVPLVAVVVSFGCCFVVAAFAPVTGNSPTDACMNPYGRAQLWVACIVCLLTSIVCVVAVAAGGKEEGQETEHVMEDFFENKQSSGSLALLSNAPGTLSSTPPALPSSSTTPFIPLAQSSVKDMYHYQLPFLSFSVLSCAAAFVATLIEMYGGIDYQQGLLRMIMIVDDIMLFGGGLVVALCFKHLIGASQNWYAFGKWVKHVLCTNECCGTKTEMGEISPSQNQWGF